MRILYIEDEEDIAETVKLGLERAGYSVTIAGDGVEGLERAIEGGWSLLIVDGMLPGIDGLDVCRRLRARRDRTPILMLTARDTDAEMVRGLDTGADDYLGKPFSYEVLLARVRALLRREVFHRASVVKIRDLEIDLTHRRALRGGIELDLTPREWELLQALVQNEGRPLSRERILSQVWDSETHVGSNMVDVYIRQLRKKIDDDVAVKLIHTVHGFGYALRRPSEEDES